MNEKDRELLTDVIEGMNWEIEREDCCHCHPEYRYVDYADIEKMWAQFEIEKAKQ